MSSLPYLHFTETVSMFGDLCTLFINSILIYFTVFYIKNIKGGYKIMVLSLANLELVFSLLEFLMKPFVHSYGHSYVYFTIDKVYGASKSLKIWGLCLYSGVYALLICLIAIQFLYRYCLITGDSSKVIRIKSLDICWPGYCILFTLPFMFAYYQCAPDQDSMSYLREPMLQEYGEDVEEIPGLFLVIYNPKTHAFRVKTLCSIGIFVLVLSFQYAVIIFCGYKIHKKLNSAALKMSGKAHGMQRQLFKTLIFQILNPFIFHHIPAAFLLITPFLDLKVSIPSGLVFCFYSIFPPVDSLVMMYLVTEYRTVMRKRFQINLVRLLEWSKKFNGKDQTTATTGLPS